MEDMLEKGNVWYVRHYEAYFDEVYVVYLRGEKPIEIKQGRTTLVSLGKGNGFFDILLAPCRLFKFAKKIKPTHYLTADLVFSWWNSILVRLLLGARIYLMPVCLPYQIYENFKKSLISHLPIWLEKKFIKLSFFSAFRVITGKNIKRFIDWLSSLRYTKDKLIVIDVIPEELPPFEFYEALKNDVSFVRSNKELNILYVGRLHREKIVEDLIEMLAYIKKTGLRVHLRIIGDGPERENLETLASETGVREWIDFLGFKPNKELINYYKSADVFVSPLTGTSLREAALCKLPVVAYNIDWQKDLLKDEENALMVEYRDPKELARQVIRILTDKSLKKRIADNFYKLALEYWGQEKVFKALQQAFGF